MELRVLEDIESVSFELIPNSTLSKLVTSFKNAPTSVGSMSLMIMRMSGLGHHFANGHVRDSLQPFHGHFTAGLSLLNEEIPKAAVVEIIGIIGV